MARGLLGRRPIVESEYLPAAYVPTVWAKTLNRPLSV